MVGEGAERDAFTAYLAPWNEANWVVYAKPPVAGPPYGKPGAVLAYLSRYTHRVAISNSRLISLDDKGVTFKWKDYRAKGRERQKTMTLASDEFIRRFLIHVLPKSFHRIRHYGLLANGNRAANLARARALLAVSGHDQAADSERPEKPDEPRPPALACPSCGGPMVIIETFKPGRTPTHRRPRGPPECPRDIS